MQQIWECLLSTIIGLVRVAIWGVLVGPFVTLAWNELVPHVCVAIRVPVIDWWQGIAAVCLLRMGSLVLCAPHKIGDKV